MERLCFFLRSFLIDKLWRPDEQVDRAPIIGKLRRKSKKAAPPRSERTAESYLRSPSQKKTQKKELPSFRLNLKKLPRTLSHGRRGVILHDFPLFPPSAAQKSVFRKDTFPKRHPATAFRALPTGRRRAFSETLMLQALPKSPKQKKNPRNFFSGCFSPAVAVEHRMEDPFP